MNIKTSTPPSCTETNACVVRRASSSLALAANWRCKQVIMTRLTDSREHRGDVVESTLQHVTKLPCLFLYLTNNVLHPPNVHTHRQQNQERTEPCFLTGPTDGVPIHKVEGQSSSMSPPPPTRRVRLVRAAE